MKRELFLKILKGGGAAFLLYLLLFADYLRRSSPGVIGSALRELTAILLDPGTQWMAFLCLGIYFMVFLLLRWRGFPDFWRAGNRDLWLASGVLILAALCAVHCVPSAPALTFLGGTVLGQGMAFGAYFEFYNSKWKFQNWFGVLVVSILVIFLSWASVWHTSAGHSYEYRSQTRWNGPWDNPNIFGLLMATGVMLALGLTVASFLMLSGKIGKWLCALLCLLAAILMGRGLLHSFSRGAWVGTVCGLAYLAVFGFGGFRIHQITGRQAYISRFKKCWLPLSGALLTMVILAFWHFRGTNWHPAQRAFSSVNATDFSWRNRIAAWEGALQMTAEHPFLGTAWGQPEPLYEHYYLPPKLTERGAFELNDYLMLGATVGIPALFCFGMYLWLSLRGNVESRKQKAEIQYVDWLRTICHAAAIVLLIGFWFDGGLFKLPTAATFWILLELGNVRNHETSQASKHE
jgi:O-antigen ligase